MQDSTMEEAQAINAAADEREAVVPSDQFGGDESFGFTFAGEAGEWFLGFADKCDGLCVRITPEEGEEFDAELVSGDWDADMYNTVRVRAWDDEEAQGTGEPFSVVVRNIHIY